MGIEAMAPTDFHFCVPNDFFNQIRGRRASIKGWNVIGTKASTCILPVHFWFIEDKTARTTPSKLRKNKFRLCVWRAYFCSEQNNVPILWAHTFAYNASGAYSDQCSGAKFTVFIGVEV